MEQSPGVLPLASSPHPRFSVTSCRAGQEMSRHGVGSETSLLTHASSWQALVLTGLPGVGRGRKLVSEAGCAGGGKGRFIQPTGSGAGQGEGLDGSPGPMTKGSWPGYFQTVWAADV